MINAPRTLRVALPLFLAASSALAQVTVLSNNLGGDNFTTAGTANTGQAVGATGWYYNNVRNHGEVGIASTFAHLGNGSVYLQSNVGPGGASSKSDIEFFGGTPLANAAGNYSATTALGTLGNLTALSFDWYRATGGTATANLSPSIRLGVVSADLTKSGYLVFEREVNRDAFGNPVVAPLDTWVSDDVFGADYRLWSSGSTLPFNLNGTNGTAKYYDALRLSAWQADYGNYYVTSINLGIGSGWGTFEGAIDNVAIGFRANSDVAGVTTTYNFEVANGGGAVPEPSTFGAFGALALLTLTVLRQRRRRN